MPKVTLTWVKDFQFLVEDDEAHSLVVDTSKEVGGAGAAIKPIALLLAALGGCMAMDIVGILRKKRVRLQGFSIDVEGERAPEHPKRYSHIKVIIRPRGDVSHADLQQAFELSRDKYCSIHATLRTPPPIDFVLESSTTQGA
jgi:putative redox protein